MIKIIKENWKCILFFTIIGLIGGIFTGYYSIESYSEEVLSEVTKQLGNEKLLILIAAIQSTLYALVLGTFGIYLSIKVGLWNKIYLFKKKPVISSIMVAIIGGLSLILFDILIFNNYSTVLASLYLTKPTFNYIMTSLFYGGIIEEVITRLFLMSLLSLIINKLFCKNNKKISDLVFIISNIIVAIIFAAGHLPFTISSIGITTPIIIRCFLLNGVIGLLFGRLYRKYGIQYSMIAHIGCHVISKLIWILFI